MRSAAREVMIAEHWDTSWEQETSRTRDVAAAELRVWKKELEFSRRREMAWQSVIVEFARHFL
jgi:hypothetical protein